MDAPSAPLVIVTATTDPFKTATFWRSWRSYTGARNVPLIMVVNGVKHRFNAHERGWVDTLVNNTNYGQPGDMMVLEDEYLGVVPAFHVGVEIALRSMRPQYIACFHDDMEILEDNWDLVVLHHFGTHPQCVLAGFGGAMSVGIDGMYDEGVIYRPEMLGRRDFGSNMIEGKKHGAIWKEPRQVAVLDGFSMIFRSDWLDFGWRGAFHPGRDEKVDPNVRIIQLPSGHLQDVPRDSNLFTLLARQGIIHHAYDVALSRLVQYNGINQYTGRNSNDRSKEVWYLPIHCHHAGGQTAVGDPGYQEWAKTVTPGGDQAFWEVAHERVYRMLKGALPYSVPDPVPVPYIKRVDIVEEVE